MEKSFRGEVNLLRLGDGDVFHGEGILAVTKALLQSGVAYVGGYQVHRSRTCSTLWCNPVITSTSWACTSKPARMRLPPRPCSVRRSTIRCAAR